MSLLEDSDPDEPLNKSTDKDPFNTLSITQRFFAKKTTTKPKNKDISSPEVTTYVQNQDTAEVVKHSLYPRIIPPKAIPIPPPAPLPPADAIRKIIIKSALAPGSTSDKQKENILTDIKKEQDEDITNIKKENDLIISKAVSMAKVLEKSTPTPAERKSQEEYPRTRSHNTRYR